MPKRSRASFIFLAVSAVMALALVAPAAPGMAASPFEDVPASTWPYAVIDHFSAKGWVSGYEGGLYTEGRTLSRYELALITGGILDRAARIGGWGLRHPEVAWLQLLVKEYNDELALLGYRLEEAGRESGSAPPLASGGEDPYRLSPLGDSVALRPAPGEPGRLSADLRAPTSPSLVAPGMRGGGTLGRTAEATAVADRLAGLDGLAGMRFEDGLFVAGGMQPSLTVLRARDEGDGSAEASAPEAKAVRSAAPFAFAGWSQAEPPTLNGVRFGARARVSWVERTAEAWRQAVFPSPDRYAVDDEELRSYDLVLDLGDVRVTADRPAWWRGDAPAQGAAFGGPVGVTSHLSVHPDIQLNDRPFPGDANDSKTIATSRAGVDMDLFVPSARLRLGWRYESDFDGQSAFEGRTTVAGMEYQLDSRARALAGIAHSAGESGSTRTTQLGLRYALGRDSSLLVGYRLVDFTDLDEENREDVRTKMATAEFVLRF